MFSLRTQQVQNDKKKMVSSLPTTVISYTHSHAHLSQIEKGTTVHAILYVTMASTFPSI